MTESLTVLKAAIDMYQSQYAATDKLWAYFSTVSLAFAAFTISSEKVTRLFPEACTAVVVYLIFCVGNFNALLLAQRQLQVLAAIAYAHGQSHGVTPGTFPVFSTGRVALFYWAVVVVITMASIVLAWRRERDALA